MAPLGPPPAVNCAQQSSHGTLAALQTPHFRRGYTLPGQTLVSSPVGGLRETLELALPGATTTRLQERLHGQVPPTAAFPPRHVSVSPRPTLPRGPPCASCASAAGAERPQAIRCAVSLPAVGLQNGRAVASTAGGGCSPVAYSPMATSSLGSASPRSTMPSQAGCQQVYGASRSLSLGYLIHTSAAPSQPAKSPLQTHRGSALESTPMQRPRLQTRPSTVQRLAQDTSPVQRARAHTADAVQQTWDRTADAKRLQHIQEPVAVVPTVPPIGVAVASPPAGPLPETPIASVLLEPLPIQEPMGVSPEGIQAQVFAPDVGGQNQDGKFAGLKEALTATSLAGPWCPGRGAAAPGSSRGGSGASTPVAAPLLRGLSGKYDGIPRLSRNISAKSDGSGILRPATPIAQRSREESLVLGVSISFLASAFMEEVEEKFGIGSDPDYYTISAKIMHGPHSRGYGLRCPRDGLLHCSYVDALDCRDANMADVMLSWVWSYSVRTVVNALMQWCRRKGKDPGETFVWQCALCMNQHRVEEKKKAGEVEPFEVFRDIFEARVQSIGYMLALLSPWSQPQYIQRIWCVFELWVAQSTPGCEVELALPQEEEEPFREALESEGMQALWRTFEKVRIQDAKATSEEDRRNILRLVDPDADDYSSSLRCGALNRAVVAQLQQWCVACSAGHVQGRLARGEAVGPAACVNLAGLLFQVSDWARALDILEAERQALQESGDTGTPEYAGLLHNAGVCLAHQGRGAEAVEIYMSAKAAYEASDALPSAQYAGLLLNLGACYGDRQQFSEALHFYSASKVAYEASSATMTPHYASLLHSMGACYARQGLQEEASRAFAEAKATHDALDAGKTPEYAELLQSMGSRCSAQGRHEEAMGHFAAARAAFEATGAARTQACAALLLNLGTCLHSLGRKEEAMEKYNEAKDAFEASGAVLSAGYGDLLRNLGASHASRGDALEAAQAYIKAKEVYESTGRASTPEYANVVQEMGELYSGQALHLEAASLYAIAKATYEALGACSTPRYAGLLQNMGVSLTHQGRHAEALQLYEGAKCIYEASGLQATPAYAGVLRNLGGSFTSQGRRGEATQFYSQAKLAYEVAGVTASPKYLLEYASLCHNIGECCNLEGRTSEACELYATARSAYESSGATSTDEYAGLLQKMGMGFASQGHHMKAMELYEETKIAYEVLGMSNTQHYAALLHNMAMEHAGQGQDEEALEMYMLAKTAYEAAGISERLEYGRLLLGVGTCHARHGRDGAALEALALAKAAYDALGATGTAEYASLLQNSGACHARCGEGERAMSLYMAAKAVYEEAGAQSTPQYEALVRAMP